MDTRKCGNFERRRHPKNTVERLSMNTNRSRRIFAVNPDTAENGEIDMSRLFATLALCCLPAVAMAQSSLLKTSTEAWSSPRLQARVGINASQISDGMNSPWQQQAGVVMGDYYFSHNRLGTSDVSSGFRATSGLLLGQRSLALGIPALGGSQSVNVTVLRQPRLMVSGFEPLQDAWSVAPYFGVGWSGASLRGGWGVAADFGFATRNNGLRTNTSQAVDDLLNELRLTPVLHLGVSYAF
jgi:hypothetical protein